MKVLHRHDYFFQMMMPRLAYIGPFSEQIYIFGQLTSS